MAHAYTTIEQMRIVLNIKSPDETKSPWLADIIAGVTQVIDRHTTRTFRTYHATQVFTPRFYDFLQIPDLLTLTSLKSDEGADAAYEYTWTIEDYYLEPSNAPVQFRPYTRIKLRPRTDYAFPLNPEAVQIIGKWGYWDERVPVIPTLGANVNASATSLTLSAGGAAFVERGWTLLLGSEQMFVRARDTTTDTITVERATNGTVGATHALGDSIERYVYPLAVTDAAVLMTARMYRRSEAPTGIVNTPGDIGWRAVYIPKTDSDVTAFLKDYRKTVMI